MTEKNERNSIFAIPLLYNAGSGVSIKVVSVMELLSAIKPVSVLRRAVMALLFFYPFTGNPDDFTISKRS